MGATMEVLLTHVSAATSRGAKKERDPEEGLVSAAGTWGKDREETFPEPLTLFPSRTVRMVWRGVSGCVPCGRCYVVTQSRWSLLFLLCAWNALLLGR